MSYYMKKIVSERRERGCVLYEVEWGQPKQLKKECGFSDEMVESYDNKHMICTECHRIKNNSIDKIVTEAYKSGDRYSHSQIIEMLREKYLKCK